jgi:hypothetical protein
MKSSLTRVRLLAAFGIVILCLALFPTLPAAAERSSNAGELPFWLQNVNMAREQGRSEKKRGDR